MLPRMRCQLWTTEKKNAVHKHASKIACAHWFGAGISITSPPPPTLHTCYTVHVQVRACVCSMFRNALVHSSTPRIRRRQSTTANKKHKNPHADILCTTINSCTLAGWLALLCSPSILQNVVVCFPFSSDPRAHARAHALFAHHPAAPARQDNRKTARCDGLTTRAPCLRLHKRIKCITGARARQCNDTNRCDAADGWERERSTTFWYIVWLFICLRVDMFAIRVLFVRLSNNVFITHLAGMLSHV